MKGRTTGSRSTNVRLDPAGKPRRTYRRPGATRSTGATACTATASRAPATARRRRSSIPARATTARGSSSSPPRPTAPSRPATTCARRSRNGLHGTSMPAFEALMSAPEIEQVIDYVIFLSMRGETELALIDEAAIADENDPEAARRRRGRATSRRASSTSGRRPRRQVLNPPVARTAADPREHPPRPRALPGPNTREKLDCTGCHGPQAHGQRAELRRAGRLQRRRLRRRSRARRTSASQKYDEKTPRALEELARRLGQPAPPEQPEPRASTRGAGGRSTSTGGSPRGSTAPRCRRTTRRSSPSEIWDLVNFVLALPYEPELLEGATLPRRAPATAPRVGTALGSRRAARGPAIRRSRPGPTGI